MKGPLTLASALSDLSSEELCLLLEQRFEREPKDVEDHVGLALQLLKPESIRRALSRLRREQLALLLQLNTPEMHQLRKTTLSSPEGSALLRCGLIGIADESAVPIPEVGEQLNHMLTQCKINVDELSQPKDHSSESHSVTIQQNWQHSAFLATQQAVLILRLLDSLPAKIGRIGTVALAARKQLGERVQASPETVGFLLAALQTAGFATAADQPNRSTVTRWLVSSDEGARWSHQDHPHRWVELATRMLETMPSTLRESGENFHDLKHVAHAILPHEYPLLGASEHNQVKEFLQVADAVAVTSEGVLTPPAALLMFGRSQEALEVAIDAFPQVVEGVYVQPDLSIIAPGPLNPTDGLQLLEVADITAPGLAARLEISETSLTRALDAGWSIEKIRALLSRLSLTGIPQPLDFLLSDVADRHGSLTVMPLEKRRSWTVVKPASHQMREALLVDSRLKQLGLSRREDDPETLLSRVSAEHVHSILTGARYPATLKHPAPDPPHPDEIAADTHRVSAQPESNWAAELAERLSAADQSSSASGMVQLVELAIRTRARLSVTAEARGFTQTFTLLPLSLSAGRMRALDEAADIERTLPLSAITAVEAVV